MKNIKTNEVKLNINEVLDKLLLPDLLQILSFSESFLSKYKEDKTKE